VGASVLAAVLLMGPAISDSRDPLEISLHWQRLAIKRRQPIQGATADEYRPAIGGWLGHVPRWPSSREPSWQA